MGYDIWTSRMGASTTNDFDGHKCHPTDIQVDRIRNEFFFVCFCQECYQGKRRIVIYGNSLEAIIQRRLRDTDLPFLTAFLRRNEDIVSINLAYNEITSTGFKTLIDYLIIHNNIYELNVQNNDICQRGMKYLAEVGRSLRLVSLRLNGNKFGVEGSQYAAFYLLENTFIKHLDVAEVDQTQSSLVFFTTVMRNDQEEHNDSLKMLDLSRPNPGCMHYFDSAHFSDTVGAMLKYNNSLTELHLQKYNFDCHDIEGMMLNGICNNTLQLLDLSNNNIGDHGIDYIAKWLVKRPAIRALLLSRNIVTDHGARTLSFSVPFSRLGLLDISYNKITDNGAIDILNTLKKSTRMRHLRLFGNFIGHPTAKIIERMLLSEVLIQDNLDVKPYEVDKVLYLAYYPADHYKQRYYDVSCYDCPPKIIYLESHCEGKGIPRVHFKYIDPDVIMCMAPKDHSYKCICYDCVQRQLEKCIADLEPPEVCKECRIFYSDTSIVSTLTDGYHPEDCMCNVCCRYNADSKYSSTDDDRIHSDDCKCYTCMVGSAASECSILSIRPSVSVCPSLSESTKKIALILKNVKPQMQEKIRRWINIDGNVLMEDLKVIDNERETSNSSTTDTDERTICHCPWVCITLSTLLSIIRDKSAETTSSEDQEPCYACTEDSDECQEATICDYNSLTTACE